MRFFRDNHFAYFFSVLILLFSFQNVYAKKSDIGCSKVPGRLPDELPKPQSILGKVIQSQWDSKERRILVLTISEPVEHSFERYLHIEAIGLESKKLEPIGVINLQDVLHPKLPDSSVEYFLNAEKNSVTIAETMGRKVFVQDFDLSGMRISERRRHSITFFNAAKRLVNEHIIDSFFASSTWALSAAILGEGISALPYQVGVASLAGLGVITGSALLLQNAKGDLPVEIPPTLRSSSAFEKLESHFNDRYSYEVSNEVEGPALKIKLTDKLNSESWEFFVFKKIPSEIQFFADPGNRYVLIATPGNLQFYDLRTKRISRRWIFQGTPKLFRTDVLGETILLTNETESEWFRLSVKDILDNPNAH